MIALKITLTLTFLAVISGFISSIQKIGSPAENIWAALTGFLIIAAVNSFFFVIWMVIP